MIGDEIRRVRKALGLTQTQVAGTELTKSYICQVERGRLVPSGRALQVIAERLGKPVQYFSDNTAERMLIGVLLHASESFGQRDCLDDAHDSLRTALALAEQTGRQQVSAVVLLAIGQVELRQGHLTAAQTHLETCLSLLSPPDNAVVGVWCTTTLAVAASRGGDFLGTVQWFQRAVDWSAHLTTGETGARAQALETYGDFCFAHQQWTAAYDLYTAALEYSAELSRERQTMLTIRVVRCLWQGGRYDEALAARATVRQMLAGLDDITVRAFAQREWGQVLTTLTCFDEAHAHLSECAVVIQQSGDTEQEALTYRALLFLAYAARRDDWFAQAWCRILRVPPHAHPSWRIVRRFAWRLRIWQAIETEPLHHVDTFLQPTLLSEPRDFALERELIRVVEGHRDAVHPLWALLVEVGGDPWEAMDLALPLASPIALLNLLPNQPDGRSSAS